MLALPLKATLSSSSQKQEFTKVIIITDKNRCGVVKHFLSNCAGINKLENVEIQLIEEVKERNCDLEGKLWSREKYWQAQLFTLTNRMDSGWDWFSSNRMDYRKNKK